MAFFPLHLISPQLNSASSNILYAPINYLTLFQHTVPLIRSNVLAPSPLPFCKFHKHSLPRHFNYSLLSFVGLAPLRVCFAIFIAQIPPTAASLYALAKAQPFHLSLRSQTPTYVCCPLLLKVSSPNCTCPQFGTASLCLRASGSWGRLI